ncbi:MAG TPA: hypothetical protein VFO27_06890, partial [Bryobacteraceae bacterium]|nr:hypothetical protein [Bryobacteraceae bacterium]
MRPYIAQVCSVVLGITWCLMAVNGSALCQKHASASTEQLVMDAWKKFQDAVAHSDKEAVAR